MSAIDLHAEGNAAAFDVRQRHIDLMRGLGVSINTIAEMGRETFAFGVAKAEALADGLYQPNDGGHPHVVMPVWENGALVDLVAWRTASPEDWLLRKGLGWALGQDQLQYAGPVFLAASPLEWLQRGGEALCILDWGCPEVFQLACLEEVTVSDPVTAGLLRQALRRPVRLPTIQLQEVAHAA
jgi:hypothetical protein